MQDGPERGRRLSTMLALVAGAAASLALASAALSFPLCPLVPSYNVCWSLPLCSAIRVDGISGPSWRCASRLRR